MHEDNQNDNNKLKIDNMISENKSKINEISELIFLKKRDIKEADNQINLIKSYSPKLNDFFQEYSKTCTNPNRINQYLSLITEYEKNMKKIDINYQERNNKLINEIKELNYEKEELIEKNKKILEENGLD